jgi:hypothetical protein
MRPPPWTVNAVADVMTEIAIAAESEREVERVMSEWARILKPRSHRSRAA